MAQIIPINTTLEELIEGDFVDQYFTASLEADETLKSITITNYQPVTGITVAQNHYTGNYNSIFTFGANALLYREGNDLKSASAWEELPPPKEADLYLFRAPTALSKTFTYTVELIYTVTTPAVPGEPGSGSVEEKKLTKVYSQTVKGNWSIWAKKLRDYVYAGN